MKKEAYYFSHDSNASQDEKILNLRADLGWEGYGLYWAIIERLRDSSDYKFKMASVKGLAISMGTKANVLNQIITEYDLFKSDDEYFWSESLLARMGIVQEKRRKAKESIERRWKKSKPAEIEKEGNVTIYKADGVITEYDGDTNVLRTYYERNTDVSETYNERNTDVIQGNIEILKGNIERKGNIEILKDYNKQTINAGEKFFKSEILAIFQKNDSNLGAAAAAAEFDKFVAYFAPRGWKSKDGVTLSPVIAAENWQAAKHAEVKTVNVNHSQKSRFEDAGRRISAFDNLVDKMTNPV